MRRMTVVLFILMTLISACSGVSADATSEPVQTALPESSPIPVETSPPVVPSETAAAPTEAVPNPKLPAAPFEAQTYINEDAGFALDYPAGWTINEIVIGPRGTHTCPGVRCQGVQFLSTPELAEAATVPEGGTRVNAAIYRWDPKNDLAAYAAQRKTAWEASGFQILEEEQLTLELGLSAVRFIVQTPDAQVLYMIAALDDQYLELSGEGDMGLVNEIVQRVRPISR